VGFPYVSSPIKLDDDPTKGKFAFCERMIVKALHASDFGFLKKIKFEMRQIENASRLKRIQNMVNHKKFIRSWNFNFSLKFSEKKCYFRNCPLKKLNLARLLLNK
jgi:hypothetical protein